MTAGRNSYLALILVFVLLELPSIPVLLPCATSENIGCPLPDVDAITDVENWQVLMVSGSLQMAKNWPTSASRFISVTARNSQGNTVPYPRHLSRPRIMPSELKKEFSD